MPQLNSALEQRLEAVALANNKNRFWMDRMKLFYETSPHATYKDFAYKAGMNSPEYAEDYFKDAQKFGPALGWCKGPATARLLPNRHQIEEDDPDQHPVTNEEKQSHYYGVVTRERTNETRKKHDALAAKRWANRNHTPAAQRRADAEAARANAEWIAAQGAVLAAEDDLERFVA